MNRIQVWADVGGTFTDCFVLRDGIRRACKVLSSGVARATVIEWLNDREAVVAFPSDHQIDRFWDGCVVQDVDDARGQTSSDPAAVTRVESYAIATRRLRLDRPLAGNMRPARLQFTTGLEAPVLAARLLLGIAPSQPLPPLDVRLGTTRGTNALLTRTGAATALITTRGFADVLRIGEQDRPELFKLDIVKPLPLAERVLEIAGRLDAQGREIEPLDRDAIRNGLEQLRREGMESIAICLMNAYLCDAHERAVEALARDVGFEEISRSSDVSPLIKLVSRAETTVLDAYLNPILRRYVQRLWAQFGGRELCRLRLMTSGGHLVEPDSFRGRDSILSGPAGGMISLQHIAMSAAGTAPAGSNQPEATARLIGLDMGGTSTDVSRYEGRLARRYESRVAGIRVLTPMMDIHTIAAGGGSICSIKAGRMCVGPESAGADPGPACYGRGGPLSVTDLNLLLGRIDASRFPFELDQAAARAALERVADELLESTGKRIGWTELAEGFLEIAVTHMAEAVRVVSTSEGSDARTMTLVGFGGAAGQHLCRVANSLGMRRILDHVDSSMLSALGMGLARVGRISMRGIYKLIALDQMPEFEAMANELDTQTRALIREEVGQDAVLASRLEADVRYQGADAPLQLELYPLDTLIERFHVKHHETFGYRRLERAVELVAIRCDVEQVVSHSGYESPAASPNTHARSAKFWHDGAWIDARLVDRTSLLPGARIEAPALVASDLGILVIEPGWTAMVLDDQTIAMDAVALASPQHVSNSLTAQLPLASSSANDASDPVLVEVIAKRMQGIADSMGEVLRRTSMSVNVKERRDYSCAIFRRDGSLIANAPHVPVHLGAMGHTVRDIMKRFPTMAVGDCFISNDPFAGGSHLPDVTVVSPVFCDPQSIQPDFFVASRAHHAEIGGRTPGSMPPDATCLAEEGVLIRGFALVRNGTSHEDELAALLASGPYPSRKVSENLADIAAQQAAGQQGVRLLQQLTSVYPTRLLDQFTLRLLEIASESIATWIESLPQDEYAFADSLDDGTKICVTLRRHGKRLEVNFAGTSDVHPRCFNATPAIVTAAVLYVLRCVSGSQLPLNEGVMRQIDLSIPTGLLNPPADVDPRRCAAVVAGNVETSQRVVDVLLGALGVAAASQGTMNNTLMGDSTFGYYETIGGGSGATSTMPGADAVHTHMTNTRITDPEVLESRLPVRLLEFAIRRGSGGRGKHRGGDGMIRRFEFLRPLIVSLISNRRESSPYGLDGGEAGTPGKNRLIREGVAKDLAPSVSFEVEVGDQLEIQTPGGGGWGDWTASVG